MQRKQNKSINLLWSNVCGRLWAAAGGGDSPDATALEHARVHQVRAHQGHVDAVLLGRLQLVAQRLVEADGAELTGAVVLERGPEVTR